MGYVAIYPGTDPDGPDGPGPTGICGIAPQMIGPTIVLGCRDIALVNPRPTLSIELPDSAQVWPHIPVESAHPEFDFSQVEDVMDNILMGWIVNIADADSAHTQVQATTNTDGEILLRFRAPQFGGQIEFEARSVLAPGDTVSAKDTVIVAVPGLVLLPNSTEYVKVGGTSNHNGPPRAGDDNNHYAMEAFRDSLVSLAQAWQELADQDSIDTDQTPLTINDISLPNGGLFDISGRWRISHEYHRVGRDADIRTTRELPDDGGRVGVLLTQQTTRNVNDVRNLLFERLCLRKGISDLGVHRKGTSQEHYHLYFY